MINIVSVFKNGVVAKKCKANNFNAKNQSYFKNNLKNNSLAPLSKDTVGFTGVGQFKTAIDNADVCQELHDDAKTTNKYLTDILNNEFNGFVYSKKNKKGKIEVVNPNGIIQIIESRIKTPDSIQEKIAGRIEDALHSKDVQAMRRNIFLPYDKADIKKHVNDIPGARIVMKDADGDNPSTIIRKLKETIEKNELVVDKIENYVPEYNNARKYFKDEDLKDLEDAVNNVRIKNNMKPIKRKETVKDSGYIALHIDFNLSNIGNTKDEKGYHSELQIIGTDVALLKDVEDLCYKLKNGKKIKSGNPAYTPFEKFFINAYRNPNRTVEGQKIIEDAFNDYTKKAFSIQSNRLNGNRVNDDRNNWAYKYPTIEECGYASVLPPILDFNTLARIKRDCDELYYVETHPQECIDEVVNNKS